jgi:ACS family hexuronate transporter-like MFS transporter
LRWRIAFLLSAAIAISYLDRLTLPVAVKAIARDIPISNEQFSTLQSAFLFAYALTYAAGGKLVDLLGTRLGLVVIMLFWSIACASHALALGFAMLVASRLLLGMGEGGGFPAATRAVAEWFPTQERATAMGIINGGTSVGAVLAPPLIALVLAHANWRWIFVLTGGFGFLWTACWSLSYVPTLGVSDAIAVGPIPPPSSATDSSSRLPWSALLRIRETRGLMTAKFLSDAAWFFYLFWLPKYLFEARGFCSVKTRGIWNAFGSTCIARSWRSAARESAWSRSALSTSPCGISLANPRNSRSIAYSGAGPSSAFPSTRRGFTAWN